MTDKSFGNYCHKHGKGLFSRCQDCIDELVEIGIQADKDRIAELVRENERLRKDAERYRWLRDSEDELSPRILRMVRDADPDLDDAIDAARGAK